MSSGTERWRRRRSPGAHREQEIQNQAGGAGGRDLHGCQRAQARALYSAGEKTIPGVRMGRLNDLVRRIRPDDPELPA